MVWFYLPNSTYPSSDNTVAQHKEGVLDKAYELSRIRKSIEWR